MLRIITAGLLLLLGATGLAQQETQQKIDSLLEAFDNADDKDKLEYIAPLFDLISVRSARPILPQLREMEQLSSQYDDSNLELMLSWMMISYAHQAQFEFDSMRHVTRKGIALAQRTENDTLLAKFYNALGVSHEKVGVLDSAEYFYFRALEVDPSLKMAIYNNLGLAYIRKSDFGQSIEYLEVALEEALRKDNINAQAVISNNIGMSHRSLGNNEKAKAYALRALALKEQLGDERGKLFPLTQLTTIELPPEEHKKYVDMALEQARKVGDPVFERLFTAKAAEILSKEQKYEAALDMLIPVYEASKAANSYDQNEVMRILAEAYYNYGQYANAERVAEEMKALAQSKNAIDEQQGARKLLMDIYKAQGKYEDALEIGTVFFLIRDSLSHQQNLDKLAAADAKLEDVEREKEIAFLNSEIEQKDIRRKWMIAVGLLLALILSLIIYYRNRRIKAQTAMIAREKEAAKKLEMMNEKLKGLDQMKNRLFTNITHEFRTPLTVMLGMAGQLESTTQEDKARRKLALIRRNGRSLLNLIKQMLDLSKIEDNKLKVSYVQGDVLPYIRYITESFHSLANAQNIMLRVVAKEAEIIMDYDPERIRQMLSNLLSNAIKYTPSGGKVKVEISTGGDAQKQLLITVEDTGPGIPADDLPHIFDRFYQSDDSIARAGGTGIGLALTKELAKLLEGDVSVDSKVGEGTAFTLKLPITRSAVLAGEPLLDALEPELPMEETANAVPVTATPVSLQAPTLLIVEDNPDVVEYLADCLDGQYQLEYAFNGRLGIEKALEMIPDIIISDVMMPEKDGFELCDALKNDERTSHIPIVLLTAKADVESRISGLNKGADAYLAKPFHQGELIAVLAQLVELRARLQARYANIPAEGLRAGEEDNVQKDEFSMEDAFLKKATALIQEHIGDASFAVQEFSKALGMSYPVVHRKLSALTGYSPSLFIRSIRLNHAKELLRNSDHTISEIAYDCGFKDPKFFSRVFSKEFGQSPSAFRSAS